MAWSTRELADLAGTTVKAVRHYHKLGLLEEPERKTNGYKQYQVRHLLRLLQIARLAELGVPLAQIATMDHADRDPIAALRTVDAELEATIARLQRIRGELASILTHRAPVELPAGFGPTATELSEADRSIIMVMSRVFDQGAVQEMQRMLRDEPSTEADIELDTLPRDADLDTRRRLAEKVAPEIVTTIEKYPWLQDPGASAPRGAAFAQGTVGQAMREIYHPAQLEVLYRAHLINNGTPEERAAFETAVEAAQATAEAHPLPVADTDERMPR